MFWFRLDTKGVFLGDDPDQDHLKGTHPKSSFKAFLEYFREILIEFVLLIMC